jgi:hypothetical protein
MAERDETKGHIEDARGRRVALLDPFSLHMLPRHDVIPPEYLGAIAKQIGPGMPRWQYRGYLTCVILFLGCLTFLIVRKLVIGMGLRFDAVERVAVSTLSALRVRSARTA